VPAGASTSRYGGTRAKANVARTGRRSRGSFWGQRANGLANLLLMVPALGELPREIQPVGGRIRPGPAYRGTERERVQGLEEPLSFKAAEGKKRSNHAWAQTAHRRDPFGVAPVDVRLERLNGWVPRFAIPVTAARQPAQVISDEVRGDVFHRPVAGDRRPQPVAGR